MILLDTSLISELMRAEPHPGVVAWLDAQAATDLYITAITRAEIEHGIARLPEGRRNQALQAAAGELLGAFADRCLAFDCATAGHQATILCTAQAAERPMSHEDAQIAAIASAHGASLATRNTKDFEALADLDLIDPWITAD